MDSVTVSAQTLDLTGDGSASFVAAFPGEVTRVVISGAGAATSGEVKVNGVTKASIPLEAGAGSAASTPGVRTALAAKAAADADPDDNIKWTRGATTVGYENVVAAAVPNPTPLATFAAGDTVLVSHDVGADATGSALVTLHHR